MQKEDSYQVSSEAGTKISSSDVDNVAAPTYHQLPSHPHHHHEQAGVNATAIVDGSRSAMVDYMLNDAPTDPSSMSFERTLSFADVMQFADFGPKLGLNQHHHQRFHQNDPPSDTGNSNTITGEGGMDDDNVYFLKFPVLSNSHMMHPNHGNSSSIQDDDESSYHNRDGGAFGDPLEDIRGREYSGYNNQSEDVVISNNISNYSNPVQLDFLSNNTHDDSIMGLRPEDKIGAINGEGGSTAAVVGNNKSSSSNGKRKRPRTVKTNEEVESQRMTHIAVERNRRKQMNEHLRVLRSLMPSSYVQRGDQASIIGGAIEFVRELEQLLQCLESQKRRRLYGDQPRPPMGDSSTTSSSTMLGLVQQTPPQVQPPMGFPPPIMGGAVGNSYHHPHQEDDQLRLADHQVDPTTAGVGLLQEESAESKSCIADIEVKVLGFDALIKILSRRRPGQLIKAIAALEDLHFTILHTNITTIEQTVLYSFNVKVANEARFTAEDIASSVQQIFTFIHANTNIL